MEEITIEQISYIIIKSRWKGMRQTLSVDLHMGTYGQVPCTHMHICAYNTYMNTHRHVCACLHTYKIFKSNI